MKTLPWLQSKTLQDQIVQVIVLVAGIVGLTTGADPESAAANQTNIGAWVAALFLVLQGAAIARTTWSRLFRANPPITEKAVIAEVKFQQAPQK